MIRHRDIDGQALRRAIRQGTIRCAGNARLKIYGELSCSSGKRMKKENRVFFVSEHDAAGLGFRPCGHCKQEAYKKWKHDNI